MTKQPTKTKLSVVKPPQNLHFAESLGKRGVSIYVKSLSEALSSGSVVQIAAADSYMKHQLGIASKKLKVRLVYAIEGEWLYVKPIAIEGEEQRLMNLLREPRTLAELQGSKLELHLQNTLDRFAKESLAHMLPRNGVQKWVLTERGMDALR